MYVFYYENKVKLDKNDQTLEKELYYPPITMYDLSAQFTSCYLYTIVERRSTQKADNRLFEAAFSHTSLKALNELGHSQGSGALFT